MLQYSLDTLAVASGGILIDSFGQYQYSNKLLFLIPAEVSIFQ